MTGRAIIHVDMDAFFASVEQRDRPELRGRPVVVGGSGNRGVVAAASYEARSYGVRSAMPAGRARRLCPRAVFVPARHRVYREVSRAIFAIFRDHTPLVEGLSLDEAFLDVTREAAAGGGVLAIGRRLKSDIARETGLTCSVGMASTKLVAKLASDYDKPDGLFRVADGEVRRFLDPLPVRRLPGIGPRTGEVLADAGILTIGQLRLTPGHQLYRLFGDRGAELAARAAGRDPSPVTPEREPRSISQETTFDQDLHAIDALVTVLAEQAESVAARLAGRGLYARTVHLKIRTGGFTTLTRSQGLDGYTRDAGRIAETAGQLFREWARYQQHFGVRLAGVGVSGLEARPPSGELLDD